MKFNPTAIAFWIFCAAIGFVFFGAKGAVTGLAIGTGISVLVSAR